MLGQRHQGLVFRKLWHKGPVFSHNWNWLFILICGQLNWIRPNMHSLGSYFISSLFFFSSVSNNPSSAWSWMWNLTRMNEKESTHKKRVGLTTKIPLTCRIIINISLHQIDPAILPLMLLNIFNCTPSNSIQIIWHILKNVHVTTPEFKDLLNLKWNKQN